MLSFGSSVTSVGGEQKIVLTPYFRVIWNGFSRVGRLGQ
jgi:hypothetical protein